MYGLKDNAHYANIYIISNFCSVDRKHDMRAFDEAIYCNDNLFVSRMMFMLISTFSRIHACQWFDIATREDENCDRKSKFAHCMCCP